MEDDKDIPTRSLSRFLLPGLVFAVVVVGLGLVFAWSQAKTGPLTISDREKVYAIAIPSSEPDTWKWHVYLPALPIGKYLVVCYSGYRTPIARKGVQAWRDSFRPAGTMSAIGFLYGLTDRELTITAKLVKRDDGRWHLNVDPIGEKSLFVRNDWLSDRHSIDVLNGLSSQEQTVFDWGEPVLLLSIQDEPFVPIPAPGARPGGGPPKPIADTILLWIEKNPP